MAGKYHATDHRAVVLESVATSPVPATLDSIVKDAHAIGWNNRQQIATMVNQLSREGLIGRNAGGDWFITAAGLAYLTVGRFDRALIESGHPRPKARKKKRT